MTETLLDQARRLDPLAVAEQLGLAVSRESGKRFISCPDHHHGDGVDSHPSCGLWTDRSGAGRFRCWSCGNEGSVVDLVQQVLGLELLEAVDWLASRFGLVDQRPERPARTRKTPSPSGRPGADPRPTGQAPLQNPQEQAVNADVYAALLAACPAGPDVRSYLAERGFTEASISYLDPGEVPRDPGVKRHIAEQLLERWSRSELEAAGVLSALDPDHGRKGNLRFWSHRLLLPFRRDGRVVYLQGRRLEGEGLRYLNSGSLVPCPWNVDALAGQPDAPVAIVEGVLDALSLHQAGWVALGVPGVEAWKDAWSELLRGRQVVLALDADVDQAKVQDWLQRLSPCAERLKVARPPDGCKDWNEVLKRRDG